MSMSVHETLKKLLPPNIYEFVRTLKHAPARIFQRSMELSGFVVARTSDYYSPLPSRAKLAHTMPRWTKPSTLRGLRLDLAEMKSKMTYLVKKYGEEFLALVPYEKSIRSGFGPGYTRVDALVLYAMIREKKPKQYLEVGSGLSTYYASVAAQRNAQEGHPMLITCVEPYPFPALATIPGIRVRKNEVQVESLDLFTGLGENDVLFIDSSHIVRLDGDVPFLFLEVLPILRPGVNIHIHDIPFPYHGPYPPKLWIYDATWPVWWNESMLLHALLCGNQDFTISLSAPLLRYHDEPFLAELIPAYENIEKEPNTFSSIWLQKVGSSR
jgi:hypothetical protein